MIIERIPNELNEEGTLWHFLCTEWKDHEVSLWLSGIFIPSRSLSPILSKGKIPKEPHCNSGLLFFNIYAKKSIRQILRATELEGISKLSLSSSGG